MDVSHTDLFKNKIVVLVAFTGISLLLFSSSTGRIIGRLLYAAEYYRQQQCDASVFFQTCW